MNASAEGCEWASGFGIPSLDGPIFALAEFDDGGGPALYAGGSFATAGGVSAMSIARWDGLAWSPLGSGVDGEVFALGVHDDGSGPALYVGGDFATAGGVPAANIARWNGTSWSAVGTGMDDIVLSLGVFNDGADPALYAGGFFAAAGGVPAANIAKWDGTTWSPLGAGVSDGVAALAVYDDGAGEALYAGGFFAFAAGVPVFGIARWDGTSWTDLDTGMDSPVLSLVVHDDGSGEALFAGGFFFFAGSVPVVASGIARWDGTSWAPLGTGVDDFSFFFPTVEALAVYDAGGGPELYVGGFFDTAGGVAARNVARWDGASWSALGSGTNEVVLALAAFDEGAGERLFAGGFFREAGGVGAPGIARWDGAAWEGVNAGGLAGIDDVVLALAVYDDGTGEALYAGGFFLTAGGVLAPGVARWDGSSWSPLDSGVSCSAPLLERGAADVFGGCSFASVEALAVYDDGTGAALYAGGEFDRAGGIEAFNIARWDGTTWMPLGSGTDALVEALAVYDDSSGPALYVGGEFHSAGGAPASRIARWDGSAWTSLGLGVDDDVESLVVYDDGSGLELYAGGEFDFAGGLPASKVASWDGASWSPLGLGVDDEIETLTVYDDGTGAALFAGGDFLLAGGLPADHIAKWDGTAWSALGSGLDDEAEALAVFDDGSGAALFVGGFFTIAGGVSASGIAKWDGAVFSPLSSGIDHPFFFPSVEALAVYDDGGGPSLFAGGFFATAGGMVSTHIAEWRCPSLDYGDTPDLGYGTLLASNGARHDVVAGFFLGASVDEEFDGLPDAGASGDDADGTDDEDGVTFVGALVPEASAALDIEASAAGELDAWVDWNADGDWDEANERVFAGENLAVGINSLSIAVPVDAVLGTTYARFRLSSGGVSTPQGRAPDGEVEDYLVTLETPATLSIDDVTLAEGSAGTTDFVFTVTRSHNLSAVAVDVATSDGSAAAGVDYTALPLQTLNFAAGGNLTQTVTVVVTADAVEELPVEDFFVNLSSPVAASLADGVGVGSILDDDDTGAPSVIAVDSVNGTGDGVLAECEEVRVAVSQLRVIFDQPVSDPAGHSDSNDVTNPANYRLFAAGPDRDLASASCAAPAGDDQSVAIDTVTYDTGAQVATLDLAGAVLGNGPHRLVVCASIEDIAGNGLAGGDFPRTFRIERRNKFVNGHLDCDLDSWTGVSGVPNEITYAGGAANDVDAASVSGSASVTNLGANTAFSLGQCIPVAGSTSYTLRAAVRVAAAPGGVLFLGRKCELFAAAGCAGASLGTSVDILPLGDSAGLWEGVESQVLTPAASASAFCSFELTTPLSETFDANLDGLEFFGSLIFADGFETGDTMSWSTRVP